MPRRLGIGHGRSLAGCNRGGDRVLRAHAGGKLPKGRGRAMAIPQPGVRRSSVKRGTVTVSPRACCGRTGRFRDPLGMARRRGRPFGPSPAALATKVPVHPRFGRQRKGPLHPQRWRLAATGMSRLGLPKTEIDELEVVGVLQEPQKRVGGGPEIEHRLSGNLAGGQATRRFRSRGDVGQRQRRTRPEPPWECRRMASLPQRKRC